MLPHGGQSIHRGAGTYGKGEIPTSDLRDAATIWAQVSDILRNDMTPNTWSNHFMHIEPIAVEDDAFVMICDDTLTRQLILSRYKQSLVHALSLVTGRAMSPRLITQEQAQEYQKPPVQEAGPHAFMLNPRYTFDSFVIGPSNRFAYAAAAAVAEVPLAYNPLFFHGSSGLGKTHLMQAIGNYVRAKNPKINLLYVTTETFTNELILALQKKTNDAFRARYRSLDMLLLDDIQFIAGKSATQEEFFHTFNTLHSAGKQIVIASDRPPRDIPTLEERLTSRFDWGLVADIQKPDIETRISILKSRADSEGIEVPNDVFYYIAEQVDSNIRELEGSLTRVTAYASLSSRAISLEIAQEALFYAVDHKNPRAVTPEIIISMVCDAFGVRKEDLASKRRDREVTVPRQIAMYLIRENCSIALSAIGALFGGRDHTTVLHACDKISDDLRTDARTAATVNDLRRQLT